MDFVEALTIIDEVAGNIAEPHRSYICFGGHVSLNGTVPILSGGVDLVWDLWNEQFSAFYYTSKALALSTLLGGSVSAYLAFGFGRFPNVHAAWSGEFNSAAASVAVPGLKWGKIGVSAGVSGFASPDFAMVGGAANVMVEGSLCIKLSDVLPGSISVATGDWSPWNQLTELMSFGFPIRNVNGNKIIGLEAGVTGVARHMAFCIPLLSVMYPALATYATAVSISKSISVRL
jgi:hypothetical protein